MYIFEGLGGNIWTSSHDQFHTIYIATALIPLVQKQYTCKDCEKKLQGGRNRVEVIIE